MTDRERFELLLKNCHCLETESVMATLEPLLAIAESGVYPLKTRRSVVRNEKRIISTVAPFVRKPIAGLKPKLIGPSIQDIYGFPNDTPNMNMNADLMRIICQAIPLTGTLGYDLGYSFHDYNLLLQSTSANEIFNQGRLTFSPAADRSIGDVIGDTLMRSFINNLSRSINTGSHRVNKMLWSYIYNCLYFYLGSIIISNQKWIKGHKRYAIWADNLKPLIDLTGRGYLILGSSPMNNGLIVICR